MALSATAPAISPDPPAHFRGWDHFRISLYWFGTNFLWGAFLGPLLASQMTRLAPQDSAGTLGVIYQVAAIPALLIPLIFGPLSDRCASRYGRRRPYIGWGVGIAVIGLFVMAGAFSGHSLATYIEGYFIVQIGANIAIAAYSGIIPDLVPIHERGRASGMMAAMAQVGTLAGAIVTGKFLGGNVTCLYVMAVVLAAAGIFTLVTVKERPFTDPKPEFNLGKTIKGLWIDPRKYPDFAWVWLTRAFMMTGFYLISPDLLYFLRDVIHVVHPEQSSAIVFAIILVSASLSGYYGGKLSDRYGRKRIVMMSSLLIAVMCVVFIALSSLTQALFAGVVFGIGYGAYISVDWALGTDVLPNKTDAGKDMAVWHISMTLPQWFGPWLSGSIILEHFKGHNILVDDIAVRTYRPTGYAIIFGVSAVFFILSGMLIRKVKGST